MMYVHLGRPSVLPEKLLRALLLQTLYTIRSERQLMEQLDYNLLFRWFVGLGLDDPVWSATSFTKNRDRLLDGNIAAAFFEAILILANRERSGSNEHFTLDGCCLRRGPVRRASGRALPGRRRGPGETRRWTFTGTSAGMPHSLSSIRRTGP